MLFVLNRACLNLFLDARVARLGGPNLVLPPTNGVQSLPGFSQFRVGVSERLVPDCRLVRCLSESVSLP